MKLKMSCKKYLFNALGGKITSSILQPDIIIHLLFNNKVKLQNLYNFISLSNLSKGNMCISLSFKKKKNIYNDLGEIMPSIIQFHMALYIWHRGKIELYYVFFQSLAFYFLELANNSQHLCLVKTPSILQLEIIINL